MDQPTVWQPVPPASWPPGGLTNGAAADTDDRLRQRLLKLCVSRRTVARGRHHRQWAEDASAVEKRSTSTRPHRVRGPCTWPTPSRAPARTRYARTGTTALTLLVANAITAEQPEFADATVTTVAHADLEIALKITLPEPPSGGGQGGGWVDDVGDRWAIAKIGAGNSNGVVTVTTVNSSTSFTVNAWQPAVEQRRGILLHGPRDGRGCRGRHTHRAAQARGRLAWTGPLCPRS